MQVIVATCPRWSQPSCTCFSEQASAVAVWWPGHNQVALYSLVKQHKGTLQINMWAIWTTLETLIMLMEKTIYCCWYLWHGNFWPSQYSLCLTCFQNWIISQRSCGHYPASLRAAPCHQMENSWPLHWVTIMSLSGTYTLVRSSSATKYS